MADQGKPGSGAISWRERVRPLAARLGIRSSAVLWHGLALRRYHAKIRENGAYRLWVEGEALRWVSRHWAHESVEEGLPLAHLTSQLYEITEMLRRRLGPVGECQVLDAGASDGFFLARVGAVQGVGVNFLQACARQIHSDGFYACRADIERLPFPDKAFDYVICCQTLEHVPNPIQTMNELLRVCRTRLFLTIPWLAATRINARPPGWPDVESHIFEFDERDFAKVLSWVRARVVFRDRIQVFPEPRNPMLQWWFRQWMYPSFFPMLQYYELEPVG